MRVARFEQMPPEVRSAIEQRQSGNGFSDTEGLHELIQDIFPDYGRCLRTTGYINQRLKGEFQEARKKAVLAKALLEVMGPELQDIGLANTALMDSYINSILPHVAVSPADIEGMEPADKIALFKELNMAAARNARNYEPLKKERRADKAASSAGRTSDEHRRALAVKLARFAEADK